MKYILENISWIVGAFATILTAILTIIFTRNTKNKNIAFQVQDSQRDKALKEIFRLLNVTLKSVTIGLSPIKVNPPKTNKEYLDEAINANNDFGDYFEETELYYTQKEISLIKEIKDSFLKCLKQQQKIENFKSMNMPQEKIFEECDIMIEYYENDIEIKIPELREKIKTLIKRHE